MTVSQAALVWCPCPDLEVARTIAGQLLREKLIACANMFPVMESLFEWEGSVAHSSEVGVLFKTTADSLDALIRRLGEVHPYDTPAILGWTCDMAHPAVLGWLSETIGHTD